MVVGLLKIWKHAEVNDKWTWKASEVRQYLDGKAQYARFGDWKHLEPDMVYGRKGLYLFDKDLMRETFTKQREICIRLWRDPLRKVDERTDFAYVDEVPKLGELLDDNRDFIIRYKGKVNLEQESLL